MTNDVTHRGICHYWKTKRFFILWERKGHLTIREQGAFGSATDRRRFRNTLCVGSSVFSFGSSPHLAAALSLSICSRLAIAVTFWSHFLRPGFPLWHFLYLVVWSILQFLPKANSANKVGRDNSGWWLVAGSGYKPPTTSHYSYWSVLHGGTMLSIIAR